MMRNSKSVKSLKMLIIAKALPSAVAGISHKTDPQLTNSSKPAQKLLKESFNVCISWQMNKFLHSIFE